jgi:predicted transcriptional regulator
MAMTLRLTTEQEELFDQVAEHMQLSRQQATIKAMEIVNEIYIRQTAIDAGFDFVMTHDKALMERLADA